MITVVDNGDGTATVKISYTANTNKLLTFLEYAGEHLYVPRLIDYINAVGTPRLYDDLTNAQKLTVIDVGVKRFLQSAAFCCLRDELVELAIEQAKTDPNVEI